MASLFVIRGRDQGKRFTVSGEAVSIGRESANPIQLHDTEVSRQHAEIRKAGSGYTVIDLGSSNGTFVNDQQVERQELQTGDHLQVGRTLLLFTSTEDSSSSDLASVIDIVGQGPTAGGSRIVKTMGGEDSKVFGETEGDSPWLARARSNLQVMYRTALAVSHTLDIDQLLKRIMELIFEWVEADRGCIMLMDRDSEELLPKARRMREGVNTEEKIIISRTILDYVLQHQEGVLTSDAKDDQRWDAAGSIVKLGVREAICVPMQGRYGIVGIIYVDTYTPPGRFIHRAPTKFQDEHLKLMIAIGHQAALAVEDTSYYGAMVQAERLAAVGQTIASLSHHIKNILQGIRGGSYLIEEGLKEGDNEVVRKGWGIVDRNQEKISNLVMDMLSFSKEREPELIANDLNGVAGDVIELMQMRAQEAGVELIFDPHPSAPQLRFDADGLHRAILNVVTNAIDACENIEQARILVSIQCDIGGEAAIEVTDNGAGIEPEDLKKIFSIFESRKGSRGTGLGLTVSRKILREHGGDISVQSTPGSGSTFRLYFPAIAGNVPTQHDTIG